MESSAPHAGPLRRAAAWSVHALTTSGAVWGVLALRAHLAGDPRVALGWLAVALAVDAIDGPLARRSGAAESVGQIDGALLDNLIDYLNYVIVPSLMIVPFLPAALGWAGAASICSASALQSSHRQAKTAESFRGFPSYWNAVAAYFLLLDPAPAVAAALVGALALLAFAPIRFVYPSRTRLLRRTTLTGTVLWIAALAVAVARHPEPPRGIVAASLAFPLYYLGLSLFLTTRRPRRAV